jgi:hypothetical protein
MALRRAFRYRRARWTSRTKPKTSISRFVTSRVGSPSSSRGRCSRPAPVITEVSWFETQLTSRQRRLDRALDVTASGERRLEHTEWQLEMTADMPFRMYEYNTLFALALAAETPAGQKTPRIRSTLVLLSGREDPWPAEGEYRTSPEDAPFSGLSFRIDAVYQRTVAEIAARGPLWTIFTPLAVDADPEQMKGVLDKLRAESLREDFEELTVAMTVVADKDRRQRGLRGAIISVLGEEVVMESWVFKKGREQGELSGVQKGKQELLVQLFERRLGRPLDEGEKTTVLRRLSVLGYDRVVDVRDELSPEALASWLANPEAA